jgi:penicillin-insensitive murein endopeptidase
MLKTTVALLALLALVPHGAAIAQSFPGSDVPLGSAPEPAPAAPPAAKPQAAPAASAGPPAKTLFGAAKDAAPLAARAIGFYSRGCLAGAKALPIDGPAWQAMRLSRNRNWGHPKLVALVEKLAVDAKRLDGWPGLLVGDMSQPRGGPMLTGHESHQIGLDADIWLSAMPDRRLTEQEREDTSAISMLGPDKLSVAPEIWSEWHVRLIKRAAAYPEVERVLVHPAIKKALCTATAGEKDRTAWLAKVRPYWGHHYHMHIRIACPPDSPDCRPQPPTANDDGCGKELTDWFELLTRPPDPKAKPAPPKPPLTMTDLPSECRTVISVTGAGGKAKAPAVTAQPR